MNNQSGILPIGAVGIIVIAFTIGAFFLLGIERITLNWVALIFLLISELVLFSGLIGLRFSYLRHGNVFLKTGVTTALSLYFAFTLASMLLTRVLTEKLNTFILIEIAIVALFAMISIAILAFSRAIDRRNEADAAKVGTSEPKRGGF